MTPISLKNISPKKLYLSLPLMLAVCACQTETVGEAVATQPAPTPTPEVAAPSGGGTISQGKVLPDHAVFDGVAWAERGNPTGRNTSRIIAVASAANVGGMTAICGVKAETGVGTRRFNTQVLRSFVFAIDGQEVLRDVNYFARATSLDAVETTPTLCKTTGLAWKPGYASANWSLTYTGQTRFSF